MPNGYVTIVHPKEYEKLASFLVKLELPEGVYNYKRGDPIQQCIKRGTTISIFTKNIVKTTSLLLTLSKPQLGEYHIIGSEYAGNGQVIEVNEFPDKEYEKCLVCKTVSTTGLHLLWYIAIVSFTTQFDHDSEDQIDVI